jgi:hypothetical protein
MAGDIFFVIMAVVVSALCMMALWSRRHHAQRDRPSATATRQPLLKPRTPDDCLACRCQPMRPAPALSPVVRLWKELKSRRGAPRRIATHGFACPNHACVYHGITDGQVHALVGDGTHGKHERVQTFRCQACGTTFTSRHDTPL